MVIKDIVKKMIAILWEKLLQYVEQKVFKF